MSVSTGRRLDDNPTGWRLWERVFLRWAMACAAGALLGSGCAAPAPRRSVPGERVALRPVSDRPTEPVVAPSALMTLPTPASPAPAATGAGVVGERRQHVLQPGDTIHIEVFREPELSGQFRLNPAGEIRHSLLGVIGLGGRTVSEAEDLVREALAGKYLVNPRVLLRLESTAASQVLLLGEVKNPGILTVPQGERLTLLEAIVRAGGFTPKAAPNRTTIVRTVDGKKSTLRVRVADVLAGRPGVQDVPLEPDDVITIPEIWF